MNFYDKIHELVKAFKDTDEYNKYLNLKSKLQNDSKYYDMLKDFKKKQSDMQVAYINTGKPDEAIQKELENTYSLLIQNDTVREFFEMEIRLDVMLADMQKIMAEGIKEIIEFK